MKSLYVNVVRVLGLTCAIILCCSCRSNVSDAYRLHVVVLQTSGSPSPPNLFKWRSAGEYNHTFPDLSIALPSVEAFAGVTNRQDIGLLSLQSQLIRRGRFEAKRLEYTARGAFVIKGIPCRPSRSVGEIDGEFMAEVMALEKERVRVRIRHQGFVSVRQKVGTKADTSYPVDQDVEMSLPLGKWVVCRYLDYDGYKPLTLKLMAYQLVKIEK